MKKTLFELLVLVTAVSCMQERNSINTKFFDDHVRLGYIFSEEDQQFMEDFSEDMKTEMEEDRTVRTYAIRSANFSQPFDYVRVHTRNKKVCAIEFQHYDPENPLYEEYDRMVGNAVKALGEPDDQEMGDKNKVAAWYHRGDMLSLIRFSGPSTEQLELARLFNEKPEETNYIIMLLLDGSMRQ